MTRQKLEQEVACGPDPERHTQLIRQFIDAGYDHICVHQIGPNQEEFMDFYAAEAFPRLLRLEPDKTTRAPEVQYKRRA